jgi:hypothetical protein
MKAKILGTGQHRLYGSSHVGFGFQLPGWNFPVIVDHEGRMFYDNYNGAWGSSSNIEQLQEKYSRMVIEHEADQLGWYHEWNEATGELQVHHPDGGVISISKGGTLDANGFVGNTCEQATARFEEALGTQLGRALKPQINEVRIGQAAD